MAKSENLWYNLSDKDMTEEEKQKTALEIVNIVTATVKPIIKETVKGAVDATVNGKIDKVHTKLDEEKIQRKKADKEINEKLDSIVSVADWFRKLGKGVVYTGILAAAITAVIVLYKQVT